MQKIKESVDMSKRAFEIDIESPVFNDLLRILNQAIQKSMVNIYEEKFQAGEITLKLTTEITDNFEDKQRVDEFGDVVNETYKYKTPVFDYKVTTKFLKKYTNEGKYAEKKELRFDGEKFVVEPLKLSDQISIEEI